jgi:hypothetical protein
MTTAQLKAVAHPLRHNWVLYYDASHNNNNNNSNNSNNNSNTSVSGNNDNAAAPVAAGATATAAAATTAATGENESEWDNALRDVCAHLTRWKTFGGENAVVCVVF